MKNDCRWLNDVECPYATGYQECDNCDKYEQDTHPFDCKCSDCDASRGCAKYHQMKDMEAEEKL